MLQRAHEPFLNYWVLPGGFIDHDETAQEAIKRETREEAGTNIKIEGLVGIYRIDNDPRGVHIDIIFYGKAASKIKLGKEDKNWQYFPTNNLPENIAYKHREAISDYDKAHHL